MALSDSQATFSRLFAQLILWAHDHGYTVAIDMVARSPEEQARLVRIGASRTLKSAHVQRLAGDLLLFKNGQYVSDGEAYRPLGAYWTSLSPQCVWGGSWKSIKDYDHFEMQP
jgi:D-alanyl-D-alanine carboxypeptidase